MICLWRACNLTTFTPCLTGLWTTRLLPSWGTQVQSPGGYLCETGIFPLALSHYIGDPGMIRSLASLLFSAYFTPRRQCEKPAALLLFSGCFTRLHADNVKSRLDLTQLFCPGFMLAAGPPSPFTTDRVGCWGGALCRACNLTTFTPCLTGPVDYLFASRHEGPGFNPQGVLMWFSC